MNFIDLLKESLNRIGTKAIVAIVAIYLCYDLSKGLAPTDQNFGLWGLAAIVVITLAFFVVRYILNDKGEPAKENELNINQQ